MDRLLIIGFLVFLFWALIYADNDWNLFPRRAYYKKLNKKDCVFPFVYRSRTYNDCTNDGDNGVLPWCSLSTQYKGKFKHCYDFRNPDLQCLDTYSVGGKQFKGCDYLTKTSKYKQCQTNNAEVKLAYCLEEHLKPSGKSLLRFNECDQKYLNLSKFHTMCMGPSDYAIPVPITEDEKDAILDKHNEYRNDVFAKYMFKVYWDDELAKIAQAHSDMCAFDHDLAENRLSPLYGWYNGQNIVQGTDPRTPLTTLLELMYSSEKPRFTYGKGCFPDDSCLHYSQMMLATITRMGCAQTHCLYPHGIDRFLVCNYIHSQYDDTALRPYERVKSPDENICPIARRDDNLCDCGNKICNFDYEHLDPRTCKCVKRLKKRSINKRDKKNAPVVAGAKPFSVSTNVELDLNAPVKRDLNTIERHGFVKRNVD